ncbi:response regulator [Aquimarina sp. ERC-38]|uniref:hybrid sensor histidine kinase/response regulator transcription factor n=1 Tax=Aquimarina sp. ERC-38 TaxID=2949996 RepID=UPI0022477D86|nr:ATP-binding protein [Aquimarina sp. ERC-38]UZO82215.1 response regulator [Aquimarina sp. ERC-38]
MLTVNKYLFTLFYLISLCLYSQEKFLEVKKNLTISDGLAHNGVTSILEDFRGFIWFGTYDGLNQYDGYGFKVFKNTVDKNVLVSNRVRCMAEDDQQNIWIGTDQGISIYNYQKQKFTNVYSNKLKKSGTTGPIIRKIIYHKEKQLLVCTTEKRGVLLFNQNQALIGNYRPPESELGENIITFDIVTLDNANYLLTTSVGLFIFNVESKTYKKILSDSIPYSKAIAKINDHSFGVLLENGIAIIEAKQNGSTFSFVFKQTKLEAFRFHSLHIDPLNNMWLGTLNDGLIYIDNIDLFLGDKAYKTSYFKPDTGVLRSSSIQVTSTGVCWYSTFNKGIFTFDVNQNPFKNYQLGLENGLGPHAGIVTNIAPLDSSQVYLVANLEGIALYDTNKELFNPLPFAISKTDAKNTEDVYVDSNKNVWLTIKNKGLYQVKAGSKTLQKIKADHIPKFDMITPRSFSEDTDGNIWIGGLYDVYKITMNTDNTVANIESLNANVFFKDNKLSLVRCVYVDPLYDFLWFGSDSNGLFRIKLEANVAVNKLKIDQFTQTIDDKYSLSSDFITSVVRLPNKELWVGTEGGGICRVKNSTGTPKFEIFSEKQGLSNNVVKSLQSDDNANLWISTNIGLNKFDLANRSFRKFGINDGLPFEDFWFISAKLKNGYYIFSGLDGICYFNPENISNTESLPRLAFGEFKIFNKSVTPGDKISNRVLFDTTLDQVDELQLKYNENVFSVELKSLHFSNPDNHSLKYRLLPVNEKWIQVPSDEQNIYYNGLPPGQYTLQVKASNSLGEWTKPKILSIIISPPFWKTWQAYLLYGLGALLLLFIVIKIILRIQKLNYNLQLEQVEIDTITRSNEEKLRFFSNISHELKTPLTLIKGPVDNLSDKFGYIPDINEKLQLIRRQSKKIGQLVDQTHDFQKANANLLKMNYTRFHFNAFIEELIMDFRFMAKNDQKQLEVISHHPDIIVSADQDKLEKVFNNLLNNAFKYTKANDAITIELESHGKDLIVKVKDTGNGIDQKDLVHIFERFYQSHKQHNKHINGSGIGLAFAKRLVEMHYGYIYAKSELHKGTTFFVRLPVVKKKEAKDEDLIQKTILTAEDEFTFEEQMIKEDDLSKIVIDSEFSEILIFFVEDNSDMRMYISEALSKFFKVKTFSNGKECLDEMDQMWPDIVISDVQMPVLNGLDLCKSIKSDIKTSHIPVILLTALADIENQIQGIRDGADDYIRKPFNIEHLITRIEALLRNRQQLRKRFQIGIPLTKENNINNRNDNAFLEKLYNLIEDNLDNQNLNLDDFIKELYMNRTHFYQKVKALTDLTPFEVLKKYRLKKAADLLVQQNKLSVNEVYVMTGFKSRTHFSKLFKEHYNVTPGKYAKSQTEKYG